MEFPRCIALVLLLYLFNPFVHANLYDAEYAPLFNGERAFDNLEQQCDFGPRPPGSQNLSLCRQYIVDTLVSSGWNVTLQNFTYLDVECANIIAKWRSHNNASIIVGAHYDTRPHATSDPDPANRQKPILGANDGASGVAVVLELARVLPDRVKSITELVLFDAEDSGDINGWQYIVGSTYYVDQLSIQRKEEIEAMILLDIVGDAELRLPREGSSTKSLQDFVWSVAHEIGYQHVFLNSSGASIMDDHSPFLNAGIPALDIIQLPFPSYWHTLDDTPDKCCASSLEIVGRVVEISLMNVYSDNPQFEQEFPILYVVIFLFLPVVAVVIYLWHRNRS